jgi:integrase
LKNRFEPWARTTFEKTSPKTWQGWYRTQIQNIASYSALANRRLDSVTSEHISDYASYLQDKGWKASSVNTSLQVLRRMFRLAVEWKDIPSAPKVQMLRRSQARDRVVTIEEEARYLGAANELMADVAVLLIDTGMRPEENARLCWEYINRTNGQNGTLKVTHGKTPAARRLIPMTERVRRTLDRQWEAAGRPTEGWVWAANTKSGHIEPSTLKKQHQRALRLSGVTPFVIYSFRHTFLTRLGESGCDAWTLARIAGHTSIAMSARYVHPTENAVMKAFDRLHKQQTAISHTVQ